MPKTYLNQFSPERFPIPPAILEILNLHWTDNSDGGAIAPMWELYVPGHTVVFWVTALKPEERECGGARFSLEVWRSEEPYGHAVWWRTIYRRESEDEALAWLRSLPYHDPEAMVCGLVANNPNVLQA